MAAVDENRNQHADFVELLSMPWEQQRRLHVGSQCRGVRLRGEGLFNSTIGQVSTFLVKLSPKLRHLPIEMSVVNDGTGQVDNIHFEVMAGFGYRALYTLHEADIYRIMIVIGSRRLPAIRLEVHDTPQYAEYLRLSQEVLLDRLQTKSNDVKNLSDEITRLKQEARAVLATLRQARDAWLAAFEATQAATESGVNRAVAMVDQNGELQDEADDSVFAHSDDDDEDDDDDSVFAHSDDDDEDDDDEGPSNEVRVRPLRPIDLALEGNEPMAVEDRDTQPSLRGIKRRLFPESSSEEESEKRQRPFLEREVSSGRLSDLANEAENPIHDVRRMTPSPTPSPSVHQISPSPSQSSQSSSGRRSSSGHRTSSSSSGSRSHSRRRCGRIYLRDQSPVNYKPFFEE